MHLSLLIPLTGAAMNALCIFIIRLLDKDFIEVYKKTLKKITALHILLMVLSVTGIVKEEEYSLLNVYGSIIKVLVFGGLFGLSARLFTFLSDTGSDFAEPVTTTTATGKIQSILGGMAEMVSILGTVVPFLVIIIAMIWFLFFSSKREKEELTRVEREAAKTKLRIDVYHRLRYVESDHVVFDPITGREVPAERACINKLIEALADESNNVS